MKAVIVEEYGHAVLKDTPLREVGYEEVKVRIAYCGIGGLDPYIITGEVPLELPWHLGYQASGIIEELDENAVARGLKVGDRVALDQHTFCGSCYNCMHDRQNFCENLNNSFMDAMMAEYNVIHQQQVWKIPDSMSLEEATLVENIGAAMPAITLAPFKLGDTFMLLGAGTCGLLILQMARLQGATKITVVEPVEAKRNLALKFGADYVIDPKNQDVVKEAMKISENRGFDRIVEGSGDSSMFPPCVEMVAQCGKIVIFSIYVEHPVLKFDFDKLWFREAAIQGVFGQPNLFPRAVDIAPKLDLKSMLGPVYPLEKWQEAIDAHMTMQHARVLVKCT
ncbi:MAG: zinc-binding dehydrogenase [Dehalococcoidia bacterium]|jgi:(R,R)-butanediol dehydrogenase/meso-butanediol dehydrogenase/diacetyl reductase/L-iditol 2-dehydrogenase